LSLAHIVRDAIQSNSSHLIEVEIAPDDSDSRNYNVNFDKYNHIEFSKVNAKKQTKEIFRKITSRFFISSKDEGGMSSVKFEIIKCKLSILKKYFLFIDSFAIKSDNLETCNIVKPEFLL
jgi:hypothetical protein